MISIVDLIKKYNIDLLQTGERYRICCPFHSDENPSLVVYPETNSWFCFTCSIGGSPIRFMMNFENITYEEARKKLGLDSTDFNIEDIIKETPKKDRDFNVDLHFQISDKVYDFLQKDPNNWEKIAPFLKQLERRLVTEKLNEENAKKIMDEAIKLCNS